MNKICCFDNFLLGRTIFFNKSLSELSRFTLSCNMGFCISDGMLTSPCDISERITRDLFGSVRLDVTTGERKGTFFFSFKKWQEEKKRSSMKSGRGWKQNKK